MPKKQKSSSGGGTRSLFTRLRLRIRGLFGWPARPDSPAVPPPVSLPTGSPPAPAPTAPFQRGEVLGSSKSSAQMGGPFGGKFPKAQESSRPLEGVYDIVLEPGGAVPAASPAFAGGLNVGAHDFPNCRELAPLPSGSPRVTSGPAPGTLQHPPGRTEGSSPVPHSKPVSHQGLGPQGGPWVTQAEVVKKHATRTTQKAADVRPVSPPRAAPQAPTPDMREEFFLGRPGKGGSPYSREGQGTTKVRNQTRQPGPT